VYEYGDQILDPTASQFVGKPGQWTQTGLRDFGLEDAVRSGVFTEAQHELFKFGLKSSSR
jgi:hypothetical protein